jgi:hypothetical protein
MVESTFLPETYTYTARSARDPNKVITMTLIDHQLQVDIPELLDTIGDIATSEEKLDQAGKHLKSQAQPTTMKVAEAITGPIQLSDVNAKFKDKRLRVTAWKRLGGLRMAPLRLNILEVDNPDAAEAFVDELNERKMESAHQHKFTGPLDYWIGWAGMILGLFVLLRWPHNSSA